MTMRLIRSRKWRAAVVVWLLAAACVGSALYHFWPEVDRLLDREARRRRHLRSHDPVCRDLAAGRFAEGSSVEDLIAAHPPERVVRAGPYTMVRYKPTFRYNGPSGGATLVAKNGGLVSAEVGWTGPDHLNLFNRMSRADEFEFQHLLIVRSAASRGVVEAAPAGGP